MHFKLYTSTGWQITLEFIGVKIIVFKLWNVSSFCSAGHILGLILDRKEGYIPYSSKFSRHKNFVKHSKFVKLLIFVIKISWLLQNFVIAARPCCGCGTMHNNRLVSAFSLGMYFSYVPRLVDFVADSDVESLVLSGSSATHLLAASRARYWRMAFAMREAR